MKVAQSFLTLCDPMNYTLHGILQARILEWVAFPFSRGSSQPRDQILVSYIAGGFFTNAMSTRNKYELMSLSLKKKKNQPTLIHYYLFGCTESWLWHEGSLVVARCHPVDSHWHPEAVGPCEKGTIGEYGCRTEGVSCVMWPQLHHMPSSYPSYFTYLCFVSSLVSPAWP